MTPRDEWIIGEGLNVPGRWYVLHTTVPMFLVEICDENEDWLADGGVTWSLPNGQVACRAVFYDDPPTGEEFDAWMFRLGEILEDYDIRVERRTARDRRELDEDV